MSTDRIFKYMATYNGIRFASDFKKAIDASRDPAGKLTDKSYEQVSSTFVPILRREITKTYKVA